MAKEITFYNGIKMPIIGLGTFMSTQGDVKKAVNEALQIGYRHFDTAYLYGNESEIGEVFKEWIDSKKLKREDLFVVTKLPGAGNRPAGVEKFLTKSLKALQLEYVDLYLIHSPIGFLEKGDEGMPKDDQGNFLLDRDTDLIGTWKAMEKQVEAGRAKSIGISNFNSEQIKRIVKNSKIKPANLQVELQVYCQQRELVAFCKALDITVVAYSPVGAPAYAKKSAKTESELLVPLTDPVVQKIAAKYKKTPAQILLRHIIQRGVAVIPKSVNPGRIKENFDILDFEISEEDTYELDGLDKRSKGRIFKINSAGIAEHPEYFLKIPY